MALPLYIPKCIQSPAHCFHPPPLDRPVRIQIEGPLVSIQKLLPEVPWHVDVFEKKFQQAGAKLAELTYRTIYGHDVRPCVENDMTARDEYLGWVDEKNEIDYYGVTFDHLVPADDYFPEVLQINIFEIDEDEGNTRTHIYPSPLIRQNIWEEDTGRTEVLSKEEGNNRSIESERFSDKKGSYSARIRSGSDDELVDSLRRIFYENTRQEI